MWRLMLLPLLLFLPSCGPGGVALLVLLGSGGGGEKKEPSLSFHITKVYPQNGAQIVDPNVYPLLRFSLIVDSNTVNNTNFTIREGVNILPATVSQPSPTEVIIKPNNPLVTGKTYNVRVSSSVRSTDGRILGKEFSSSFTVGDLQLPYV
ncbi:MAG: Ig-like domain-containing protein, partial [Planctomycetota bacterium]|nr:Ig-like domain-containing protein [Planctomycetota bacterium]